MLHLLTLLFHPEVAQLIAHTMIPQVTQCHHQTHNLSQCRAWEGARDLSGLIKRWTRPAGACQDASGVEEFGLGEADLNKHSAFIISLII